MYSNNNNDGCALTAMALIFGIPMIMIIGYVVNGFVLSALWGWFIVPVFALPAITIVQAIGLSMVVGFLTYQYQSQRGESIQAKGVTEALVTALFASVIRAGVVFAIGWIVQLFM